MVYAQTGICSGEWDSQILFNRTDHLIPARRPDMERFKKKEPAE